MAQGAGDPPRPLDLTPVLDEEHPKPEPAHAAVVRQS